MNEEAQISMAELAQMNLAQIQAARKAGQLDSLLAGNDPGRPEEPFVPPVGDADQGARGQTYASFRDWLRSLSTDEIVRLRRAGALDAYLRGDVS